MPLNGGLFPRTLDASRLTSTFPGSAGWTIEASFCRLLIDSRSIQHPRRIRLWKYYSATATSQSSLQPCCILKSIVSLGQQLQKCDKLQGARGLHGHIDHNAAYRRAQPICRLTRPAASVKQQLCNAAVTSFDLAARRPNRTPSLLVLVPGPPGLPHAQLRW